MELRDARKTMQKKDFETHLQQLYEGTSASRDNCRKAVIAEMISSLYHNTSQVDKSIAYREEAGKYYKAANDRIRANFCVQNIGFIYEEQKKDLPTARRYILQALKEWEVLKDTMQQANLNKYLGYLDGKEGKYKSGRKFVNKAIKQYKAVGNENGIAVCYFDMGTIMFHIKKYDDAIRYYNNANIHWQQVNNIGRLFNVNNELLRIYVLRENISMAASVFNSNASLHNENIYWKDRLNFYEYACQLHQLSKDKNSFDTYLDKYNLVRDSLIRNDVNIN